MANVMSVTSHSHSSSSIKQISVVGLVSMVAVLHSHIYWFYSVMYIAYNRISPGSTINTSKRWQSYQGKIKHSSKRSSHKNIERRLQVVSQAGLNSTALLLQGSVPILNALETYPSSKKQPFDIRQFINSERKTTKSIRSTGHIRYQNSKLQPLVEVDTRQQTPVVVVLSSDDDVTTSKSTVQVGRKRSNSKRDKALILLRSTFQRGNSGKGDEITDSTSTETAPASIGEQQLPTPVAKKRKRRNTLLGITRKFSARNNSSSSFSQKESSPEESLSTPLEPKKDSHKLFRSLSLFKNKK